MLLHTTESGINTQVGIKKQIKIRSSVVLLLVKMWIWIFKHPQIAQISKTLQFSLSFIQKAL